MKKTDKPSIPVLKLPRKQIFLRNAYIEDLLEDFFVSAVFALLGIRLFLAVLGYPKIAIGGLHIAHMLWGGLLMFVAVFLLLSFTTKPSQKIAAIIGGLGFGTFIDEIGKFVTSSNNYFFQPALSIIYIVFVLTYVAIRALSSRQKFTDAEYLVNGLDALKEYLIHDLDIEEKKRAISYLKKTKTNEELSYLFLQAIKSLETKKKSKPSLYYSLKEAFLTWYGTLIRKKWFATCIEAFFVFQFVVLSYYGSLFFFALGERFLPDLISGSHFEKSISESLLLLSYIIAGIFVIGGIVKLRKSRLKAFQDFKKSLLVSVLVVQVLTFYQDQLSAIIGLVFNIILLNIINSLIKIEEELYFDSEI